jgi:hypothetical protein
VLDNPKNLITRLAYTQGRLEGRSGRPGTDEELATVLRDAGAVLGDAIDAIKEAAALYEPIDNAKLFPEGRTFYYEGNKPAEFAYVLEENYGLEPNISFHCPPELLDEIEDPMEEYPLGT